MADKEILTSPIDTSAVTSVEDLVLLRTTVEKWTGEAADAVGKFMRRDGSFWKDSKAAAKGGGGDVKAEAGESSGGHAPGETKDTHPNAAGAESASVKAKSPAEGEVGKKSEDERRDGCSSDKEPVAEAAPVRMAEAPHITTSARAYIALLYADRLRDTSKGRRNPDWASNFKNLLRLGAVGRWGRRFYEQLKLREDNEEIDPYEVNTFDIAHLADFEQVSQYLSRFYEIEAGTETFYADPQVVNFAKDSEDSAAGSAADPTPTVDVVRPDGATVPSGGDGNRPVPPRNDDENGRASDGAKADDPVHGRGAQASSPTQEEQFDPKLLIKRRLLEAIAQAASTTETGIGFPGEVRFEEGRPESRHYFATLHTLRALHALGVREIEQLSVVVAGARSFAIEQAYYFQRGATHRQDPVRLAFAGCIYAIYDEHVDKDLCLAIVECLAAAQQENGSWPATHPVFRKNNVPWHIASHEVALCLSWLYFQPRVPDAARPLIVEMMRRYLLNGVIPTFYRTSSRTGDTSAPQGSTLNGWQDDHTVSPDTTLGWATAIVCHFLAGFTHVLTDWINRRVIEELDLQLATEGYLIDDTASSPSSRWRREEKEPFVWPDLPPHGWSANAPDPVKQQEKIVSKWTDPSEGAEIVSSIVVKVVAPIDRNPSEQPQPDRCAGLMPGSPGTRKTSLVKQIAALARWPMVAVPASSIFEEGFDRMEARANRVFSLLNHLRGCVIFFDEFEEFFLSRGEDENDPDEYDEDDLDGEQPLQEGLGKVPTEERAIVSSLFGGTTFGGGVTPADTVLSVPAPSVRQEGRPRPGSDVEDSYKSRTIAAFTTSAMLPRLQELHDKDRCLIFLATNYPKKIDSAIKRAGRFDFTITVNHPTIVRLEQYFAALNENSLKLLGLESADGGDVANLQKAIVAAIKIVAATPRTPRLKRIKFSIVEDAIRKSLPIKGKSEDALRGEAVDLIEKQLATASEGNPPELVTL